jgi:hypothetical protein
VQAVGDESQIAIVRNGQTLTVPVTTGSIQGEWVVVESAEIQAGDAVVGSVTSLVGEDTGLPFGPGAGGGARPAGGGAFGPRPND